MIHSLDQQVTTRQNVKSAFDRMLRFITAISTNPQDPLKSEVFDFRRMEENRGIPTV